MQTCSRKYLKPAAAACRPPELILGQDRYGAEVDMWSVGCIFAEMLMGKALFPGKDEPDQMDKITKLCGSISEKTTPGCEAWPQCAPLLMPVLLWVCN